MISLIFPFLSLLVTDQQSYESRQAKYTSGEAINTGNYELCVQLERLRKALIDAINESEGCKTKSCVLIRNRWFTELGHVTALIAFECQ